MKRIYHFLFPTGLISCLFLMLFNTGLLAQSGKISVNYEQYKLSNGLDVILHVDKSDPIVAVAIQYHVGSNREEKGRTGFAHLFEHMMFQRSENVGEDQFFKFIQNAGGTLNGGTGNDGTIYFEVLPKIRLNWHCGSNPTGWAI
jgi:zinc protease